MKLCLTAVGAAVAAREKRNQTPTTPRTREIIALVSRVGNLATEVEILLQRRDDGNQTNTEAV
jgi:hypothetical protein